MFAKHRMPIQGVFVEALRSIDGERPPFLGSGVDWAALAYIPVMYRRHLAHLTKSYNNRFPELEGT